MTTNQSLSLAAILVALFATIVVLVDTRPSYGGISTVGSMACTVSAPTSVTVGNQASSVILATSSRRAWARISQPLYATNTISIALNGASAVANTGILIASTTAALVPTYLDFGLNADLPYTGAVAGITSTGSTTLAVTQCNY